MTDTATSRQDPSAIRDEIVLIDSSAIVALVDRNDRTHGAAVDAYRSLVDGGFRLFTTNFIIAETISLLTEGPGPDIARQWLRDHRLTVYHADEEDEQRARALVVASRSPRGLSYTDAVSMVVMQRLGISNAFSVDPDFLAETN
ncbi:MAG TPA: PIN domain-containing protein [Thermomicrobiales bacterium]|jgi:predicted nucleic acid-binding protein|nr:PIN domain-containing protein [Thermomicrobiales bacterium]